MVQARGRVSLACDSASRLQAMASRRLILVGGVPCHLQNARVKALVSEN